MFDVRKTLIAGGALAFLIFAIVLAVHVHNARIRAEMRIKELTDSLERRTTQLTTTQKAKTDTVKITRIQTDTSVVRKLKIISTRYEQLRAKIDTSHAAQPEGTPVGFTLVPNTLLAVMDSLKQLNDSLQQRLLAERRAADARFAVDDSLIATTRALVVQEHAAALAARCTLGDKLKQAGAIAVAAVVIDRWVIPLLKKSPKQAQSGAVSLQLSLKP